MEVGIDYSLMELVTGNEYTNWNRLHMNVELVTTTRGMGYVVLESDTPSSSTSHEYGNEYQPTNSDSLWWNPFHFHVVVQGQK